MPGWPDGRPDGDLLGVLQQVAPGTPLRDGLERILRSETGGLIVLGEAPQVQALFSGGFRIDVPFTAQRLSELAKMDGAIVLDEGAEHILWANVHLMPNPAVPTAETGTRHRTAERVARQTKIPVITVSQSMHMLTLYVDDWRHVLDTGGALLSRGNQAVQTLEQYRGRFDTVASSLTALEVEDAVTQRDVLEVLARSEMLRRIGEELERYVAELGVDGRLLQLQLDELTGGVDEDRLLIVRDYLDERSGHDMGDVLTELTELSPEELVDTVALSKALHLSADPEALELRLEPRGYRLLSKLPRLPVSVIGKLVERFGTLQAVMAAGVEDLAAVEGVGQDRAHLIREGLVRLAEVSMLERYA